MSFLFELELLREAVMTRAEALNLVRANGYDEKNGFSKEALGKFKRNMAKRFHPDAGGNEESHKEINLAIDLLSGKNVKPGDDRPSQEERPFYSSPPPTRDGGAVPPWAWAGHSGGTPPNASIYRQNYTDMNFVKKTMYDLSLGEKQQEFHLMAFDGYFFRSSLTTFGSMEILQDMAEAMYIWNSNGGNPYATRAIFFYTKAHPRDLCLLFADNRMIIPPIHLDHESMNVNPANDQHFVRSLPAMLDRLRDTGTL